MRVFRRLFTLLFAVVVLPAFSQSAGNTRHYQFEGTNVARGYDLIGSPSEPNTSGQCAGEFVFPQPDGSEKTFVASGVPTVRVSTNITTVQCNFPVSVVTHSWEFLDCPDGYSPSFANRVCVPPPPPECRAFEVRSSLVSLNGTFCTAPNACLVQEPEGLQSEDGFNFELAPGTRVREVGECPFGDAEFNEAVAGGLACEFPFVVDPVNQSCVCGDGNQEACDEIDPDGPPDDNDDNPNSQCDDSDSCLERAASSCDAGQELMNFNYFGGGNFDFECGQRGGSCSSGFVFSNEHQACIQDTDADGISDVEDPEPDNSDINGDSDGDGFVDSNDDFPNDPNRFRDFGGSGGLPSLSLTVGGVVSPVGPQSGVFDDSAIVAAVNENTKATNSTNQLLGDLNDVGKTTNDILANGLSNVASSNRSIEGSIDESNDLLRDIRANTNHVDTTSTSDAISAAMSASPEELGLRLPTVSDSAFIDTLFGSFPASNCSNPKIGEMTLDICSHSERVLTLLEFLLYGITLFFVYHEFHSVLRRRE